MSIKIESAKDSGRTFGDPKVTVYEAIALVDGIPQTVDCFTNRVMDFIGKEIPGAVITPNKNPQYHAKLSIPKEGQNAPYQKFFGGGGGKSYGPDPIITAKNTILMQLVEIIKVYRVIDSDPQKAPDEALKWVLNNMDRVWASYGYKTPEIAQSAAIQASTGASNSTPKHELKPALVAILKEKFKGWHSTSIVKFGGTVGLVIPHDNTTGTIFWEKLSDEDANTIINEMEKT